MVAILLVPAFIVGAHVPLYTYYLRRLDFAAVYALYHFAAVAGLLALTLVVLPHAPLSVVFITIGLVQIAIGASILIAHRTGRFRLATTALSWRQLTSLSRCHARPLLTIAAFSTMAYFSQLTLTKILLYYEFIARPTYDYFIIASLFFVVVGSCLGRLKISRLICVLAFAVHASATILLLPLFAHVLVSFQPDNLHTYLLMLDALAFAPLLWSSVFLCRTLAGLSMSDSERDALSGLALAAAGVGDILGFGLVIAATALVFSPVLLLPLWLIGAVIIALLRPGWRQLAVGCAGLCVVGVAFALCYHPGEILSEGLVVRGWLSSRRYPLTQVPTLAAYRAAHPYTLQQAQVAGNAIAGIFTQEAYDRTFYVLDGYVSHQMNHYTEVLVGLLARRYFPDRLSDSFVIGLGSGQTPAGVAMIADHTTVAEINPAVIDFLPLVENYNHHLATKSAVTVAAADGMTYLKKSRDHFPLILNTATNVYTAGAAKLSTREFLTLVRDHLSPDGVYVSWIDAGSIVSHQDLGTLLHLLADYFTFTDLHLVANQYAVLVSYNQPRPVLPSLSTVSWSPADATFLAASGLSLTDVPVVRYRLRGPNATFHTSVTQLPTMDQPLLETLALQNYLQLATARRLFYTRRDIWGALGEQASASGALTN